jgi:hypothetical protein
MTGLGITNVQIFGNPPGWSHQQRFGSGSELPCVTRTPVHDLITTSKLGIVPVENRWGRSGCEPRTPSSGCTISGITGAKVW